MKKFFKMNNQNISDKIKITVKVSYIGFPEFDKNKNIIFLEGDKKSKLYKVIDAFITMGGYAYSQFV